jgi:lysophospholipase-2
MPLKWNFDFSVRLGIGGFSMGAATALHSAACYAHGRFTNGAVYPITLSAVIGLSGWLPCSRYDSLISWKKE